MRSLVGFLIVIIIMVMIQTLYRIKKTLYRRYRILIAIITTDQDIDSVDQVHQGLKNYLTQSNIELLVVTRRNDIKVINKWNKLANHLLTVEPYDITKGQRDDSAAIVGKRTVARKFALANNYQFLWFVDANIIVKPYLNLLLIGLIDKDYEVVAAPYQIKWLGYPAVGNLTGPIKVVHNKRTVNYGSAQLVSMGCTLISRKGLSISFDNMKLTMDKNEIEGDDVGFCWNCHSAGYKIGYIDKLVLTLN